MTSLTTFVNPTISADSSPRSGIDPGRSGGKGNNHPLSPLKKQAPLRNNHFITWFYTDLDKELDPVVQRIKEHCVKAIGQTEICPTTGKPHIHLMLWGKKKFRDTQLALPKESYNGAALVDVNNYQNYANKSESHDGVWRWIYPEPPFKQTLDNLYQWEKNVLKVIHEEPGDRHIHWFWEPNGGAGKTTFQKYVFSQEERVVVLSGKAADMKNGIVSYYEANKVLPRTVLINIPRTFDTDYISYTGMEEIKDMFFYSGKYQGGMVCGKCPHVIIFANVPPPIKEDKMSKDRWIIERIVDDPDLSESGLECKRRYEVFLQDQCAQGRA